MNEAHFAEIEKVLLYVSEARERAEIARIALEKDGAEPHLIASLRRTEEVLRQQHRKLMQETYYAVPGQERLAV